MIQLWNLNYTNNPTLLYNFIHETISLLQNGSPLIKTDRVYSEVNVAFTVLINKKAKRDDSGNYTLVLKNQHGSDNGSCRVLVVGKWKN